MDVQNKRTKSQADIQKGQKSGLLDEKGEYRFLSCQVNGVSYTVYGVTPLDLMLQGKDLRLDGEEGKQLEESMKRYSEYTRLQALTFREYQGESGMKGIVENVYKRDLQEKIVRELVNINKLLNGKIEGFQEALVKRHSDNMKQYGITM